MAAYLYTLPSILFVAIFIAYPMVSSFYLSFTKYNYAYDVAPKFVGFEQYLRLPWDEVFIHSLINQLRYGVLFFGMCFVISFGVAVVLNELRRMRNLFQLLILLPIIIPGSLAGVTFLWILDYNFGILNFILERIGFFPVNWLFDPEKTIYVFAPVKAWYTLGFPIIMFFSGLQGIPDAIYDAAKIDGANFFQEVIFVTLPNLRQYMIMVIIWLIVNSVHIFEIPYVMTKGGPGHSTYTLYFYSWTEGFQVLNMGRSAAIAYVMAGMILIFALGVNKILTRE